uniref:IRG-type G domain-containing protein n=1 Tax=Pygocentrus nattereri TaxID=42514 RepID=A0A3B4DE52_PYGNA
MPREVSQASPPERRPWGRPRTRWRDYIAQLAWERLGIPLGELVEVAGEKEVWASLLRIKKAQEQIEHLPKVSLSVAVTGESGAGKSTFINAFRNLDDEDEGAAETGVTQTTTEPTPYEHPTVSNVVFWDLAGVGTPNFQAKTYDFFLNISSERFRGNDSMLAKEIQKKKKLFYFEFGNPKVFLISSLDVSEFDFNWLVATLLSELPQHKQCALLLLVPVSSVAILEEKVKMFEKEIWAAALLSAGIAVAPVPRSFFTRCYYAFCLDDKSLEKLSERVNKPDLTTLEKSPLLKELAQTSAVRMGVSALGQFLCSLIPVAGSAAAADISFTTTRDLLQKSLKELADEARKVLREAGLE